MSSNYLFLSQPFIYYQIYMTVYIKIKNAIVPQLIPITTTLLKVQAEDSQLFTRGHIIHHQIQWNVSLISSITQNKLIFQFLDQSMNSNEVLKADLYFSTFRCLPDKQISESLIFINGMKIFLQIYYTQNPRYLGQLQFYNIQQMPKQYNHLDAEQNKGKEANQMGDQQIVQSQVIQFKKTATSPVTVNSNNDKKPKVNFFFCCGDEGNDKNYEIQEDYGPQRHDAGAPFKNEMRGKLAREKIFKQNPNFYKGPCQNKNLFSVCDGKTKDEQFQIVQDHYRQK